MSTSCGKRVVELFNPKLELPEGYEFNYVQPIHGFLQVSASKHVKIDETHHQNYWIQWLFSANGTLISKESSSSFHCEDCKKK